VIVCAVLVRCYLETPVDHLCLSALSWPLHVVMSWGKSGRPIRSSGTAEYGSPAPIRRHGSIDLGLKSPTARSGLTPARALHNVGLRQKKWPPYRSFREITTNKSTAVQTRSKGSYHHTYRVLAHGTATPEDQDTG